MYAYISMYNLNKDYPSKCSVIYLPRSGDNSRVPPSHNKYLDQEEPKSKFRRNGYDTTPRGITESDDLLYSNNML